jgi:hypothetical protein
MMKNPDWRPLARLYAVAACPQHLMIQRTHSPALSPTDPWTSFILAPSPSKKTFPGAVRLLCAARKAQLPQKARGSLGALYVLWPVEEEKP